MRNFEVSENLNENLQQLEWDHKLAVAVPLGRLQINESTAKSVYCFDKANNIETYPLKIFMIKEFPLQKELNQFIQRMSEGGLIAKWAKGTNFQSSKDRFQSDQNQISMNIIPVGAIFCSCLVLFDILIFILELIMHKKIRTPGSFRIWRFIELMINPDRLFLNNDLSY